MSSTTIISGPRPKIHRLPVARKPEVVVRTGIFARRGALALSGVVLFCGLWVFGIIIRQPAPAMVSASGKSAGLASSHTPGKPDDTIVIQGKSEMIVGQLTKFPKQNEQITDIKAISQVDNNAGRELLSIISKY